MKATKEELREIAKDLQILRMNEIKRAYVKGTIEGFDRAMKFFETNPPEKTA